MIEELRLNVPLLRRRVPNLTVAARSVGLRPATVSDLCNGKIPLGRAEVRTLAALAELAGCSLDDLVLRGRPVEMIETGIKVLDLFAPLVRGGSVGLVSRQGLGQLMLLTELVHRLRQRAFATVVWLPAGADPQMQEAAARAEAVGATRAEVCDFIERFRKEREVLVAADRQTVLSGELDELQEQLRESGEKLAHAVTYALVDAAGESPDEDLPYGPLETVWRFDLDLAARGLYPAVDPVSSTSTLLEGAYLEPAHLTEERRARKLLRRYRELSGLARIRGVERIPAAELATYRRGERLEAFLAQRIDVVEPFTREPGTWVEVQETIEGVRRILDGGADEMAVTDLQYKGSLRRPTPEVTQQMSGHWMDEVVAEMTRRGDFDNLPGKGKPQALRDSDPYAGDEAQLYKILKDANVVPEWIELRRKIAAEVTWLRENPRHPERMTRLVEANQMIDKHNRSIPNPSLAFPKIPRDFGQ